MFKIIIRHILIYTYILLATNYNINIFNYIIYETNEIIKFIIYEIRHMIHERFST